MYKIGDRVLVTEDLCYDKCQLGKTGTIIGFDHNLYHVTMDDYDYSDCPHDPITFHVFEAKELGDIREVPVPTLLETEDLIPTYGSAKAAGADLRANIDYTIILKPLCRAIVPTGVRLELPEGHEAQVRPRSGLAAKKGLSVLNSPGTIDEDYRGEIKVILVNLSNDDIIIKDRERIAQLVISPYIQGEFKSNGELTKTDRGAGGLGSTGTA